RGGDGRQHADDLVRLGRPDFVKSEGTVLSRAPRDDDFGWRTHIPESRYSGRHTPGTTDDQRSLARTPAAGQYRSLSSARRCSTLRTMPDTAPKSGADTTRYPSSRSA